MLVEETVKADQLALEQKVTIDLCIVIGRIKRVPPGNRASPSIIDYARVNRNELECVMSRCCFRLFALLFVCLAVGTVDIASQADAAELHIGAATTSITPDEPVALSGLFSLRVSEKVESPCTATALALETKKDGKVVDQAIMISCDLVVIRKNIQSRLRKRVAAKLIDFDQRKLFVNATHTHTAPAMVEEYFCIPKGTDVMPIAEYTDFLIDRLTEIAVKAWRERKQGGVSWGLGHAVVAINRRVTYADGTTKQYGKTNQPDFRSVEGYEDHAIDVLFFWNAQKKLIAMAVDVACPSQEVASRKTVNADFWHETRLLLRARYGNDLCVLGWCGAAGDQGPWQRVYNQAAEERMRRLRKLTPLEEIARRIDRAVDEAHEVAKNDIRTDVKMVHTVKDIELPARIVTDAEYEASKAMAKKLSDKPSQARARGWHQEVVDRYERNVRTYKIQFHTIRLGDVAICTNPFELFTDYGIRMKARSRAVQTFVIQLVGENSGTYLPTEKAVRGGSYGATVHSNRVGPKGGQVLVEETVKAINSHWTKK